MHQALMEIRQILTQMGDKISQALEKLDQLQVAKGNPNSSATEQQPNPAWFRPSGHLSDAGVQHAYALYDAGRTVEQVASAMGISVRGSAGRRASWLKDRRILTQNGGDSRDQ
jgi:hypothetical protein